MDPNAGCHNGLSYVGKQIPQHSMQISRQSEDSQQASMMPQSMSQGQLQSSPSSSVQQQQQQQASDVQAPHEACATIMLHSVRNSQNRQAKMQWTQQSGSERQKQSGRQQNMHETCEGIFGTRECDSLRSELGAPEPDKKKSKEVTSSPAVLINRLLSNCSIIMQTARLLAQG